MPKARKKQSRPIVPKGTAAAAPAGQQGGSKQQKQHGGSFQGSKGAFKPPQGVRKQRAGKPQHAGGKSRQQHGASDRPRLLQCKSVVDRQAAWAMQRLVEADEGRGRGATLKSLTLAPHIQAKKATYAVTCQAMKCRLAVQVLDDVKVLLGMVHDVGVKAHASHIMMPLARQASNCSVLHVPAPQWASSSCSLSHTPLLSHLTPPSPPHPLTQQTILCSRRWCSGQAWSLTRPPRTRCVC